MHVLLRPFIKEIIHSSVSLSTGFEAITALECYAQHGYLRSTTLFATIDIPDICHTLPHNFMLEGLEKFLSIHACSQDDRMNGLSITTIVQLAHLVLSNQFYLFEQRLYQQLVGGLPQTNFIQALVDIYLFHVQDHLISILNQKNELFGRSLNQIFLTWNGTRGELQYLINKYFLRRSNYTNIRIITSIGYSIRYFDTELNHCEGILQTRVYHNPMIEPYALPFLFQS